MPGVVELPLDTVFDVNLWAFFVYFFQIKAYSILPPFLIFGLTISVYAGSGDGPTALLTEILLYPAFSILFGIDWTVVTAEIASVHVLNFILMLYIVYEIYNKPLSKPGKFDGFGGGF